MDDSHSRMVVAPLEGAGHVIPGAPEQEWLSKSAGMESHSAQGSIPCFLVASKAPPVPPRAHYHPTANQNSPVVTPNIPSDWPAYGPTEVPVGRKLDDSHSMEVDPSQGVAPGQMWLPNKQGVQFHCTQGSFPCVPMASKASLLPPPQQIQPSPYQRPVYHPQSSSWNAPRLNYPFTADQISTSGYPNRLVGIHGMAAQDSRFYHTNRPVCGFREIPQKREFDVYHSGLMVDSSQAGTPEQLCQPNRAKLEFNCSQITTPCQPTETQAPPVSPTQPKQPLPCQPPVPVASVPGSLTLMQVQSTPHQNGQTSSSPTPPLPSTSPHLTANHVPPLPYTSPCLAANQKQLGKTPHDFDLNVVPDIAMPGSATPLTQVLSTPPQSGQTSSLPTPPLPSSSPQLRANMISLDIVPHSFDLNAIPVLSVPASVTPLSQTVETLNQSSHISSLPTRYFMSTSTPVPDVSRSPLPLLPTPPPPLHVVEPASLDTTQQSFEHKWQGILLKYGVWCCGIKAHRICSAICQYEDAFSEPTEWPATLNMGSRTDFQHVMSRFTDTPPYRRELCLLFPSTRRDHKGIRIFISYLRRQSECCVGRINIPSGNAIWERTLFLLPFSDEVCSMLHIPLYPSDDCLIALVLPKVNKGKKVDDRAPHIVKQGRN